MRYGTKHQGYIRIRCINPPMFGHMSNLALELFSGPTQPLTFIP